MLSALLESHPLFIGGYRITSEDIECVVARIQEDNNLSQDILALAPLNLETEEADIRRLIAPGGSLERIVNSDLADLDYQIESKCDDCVFSVHCLTESARERRLELLGLEPSVIRSLRNAGINSIDDLAELDLAGGQAITLRQDPSYSGNLELMRLHAQARRKTLPGGDTHPDEYEVISLPNTGQGQLPQHETSDGRRLIRIYLSIDYDYVENRIGALAAHVTNSNWQLHTGWLDGDPDPETGLVRRVPNHVIQEQNRQNEIGRDGNNRPIYEERPLLSRDVIHFKNDPWTGDYVTDTSAERTLIQSFLSELVDAIADVAELDEAPIHYYIWSRSDMAQLVEGCSRASSRLLASLRELLGCRDHLEQLIYSCLQEEVDQRFALGWTSRGLSVAASLKWFGNTYHWQRRVSGRPISLHQEFTQDIFDFKTDLWIDPSVPAWTEEGDGIRHKFEIRSRFHDSLTAPYWRAFWRSLPNPSAIRDARVRRAINSYNNAQRPNNLREYLRARVHALRWIEERIRFKNPEISKPNVIIANLPDFNLGVNDTARAALDFLKLDQHINLTSWIAEHLVPPLYRISTGKTIPLRNIVSLGQVDDSCQLTANLDLTDFDINLEAFRNNCNLGPGAFVRLSPFSEARRGQTFRQLMIGGITCTLQNLDWDSGEVSLSVVRFRGSDLYRLGSRVPERGPLFDRATLDESPSDFVAPRVDNRLQTVINSHVYQWFHPELSQIPAQIDIAPAMIEQYQEILRTLRLRRGRQLAQEQREAATEGLRTRIQLLQGPPGTGKTETTAASTLLRILARRTVRTEGKNQYGEIVVIAAHTHTAVNNLLQRIHSVLPHFIDAASESGLRMPPVRLAKVVSRDEDEVPGGDIPNIPSEPSLKVFQPFRENSVLIIGGTTGAILKLAKKLEGFSSFKGFPISTLIVDEASMMVFPHFLALTTLVGTDGEIMLTGDHRQLSPIVAHDWENEDRPPVVAYQPYVSAYQAVLNIKQNLGVPDSQILCSALSFTFRLPPLIRELVARLYVRDGIHLTGPERNSSPGIVPVTAWEKLWSASTGLYLVLHSERRSRKNNETEVAIVEQILEANYAAIPENSVAIVTPHRAQKALLNSGLTNYRNIVDVVDTVERLQGGERPTVIVSATASDPSAISKNVEFILDLNRSNVAFSRAQERLIVVCSSSLLDHIPADLEHYESAMLWKSLREICSQEVACETVNGHTVQIFTPPDALPEAIVEEEL
ncbi:AAA family ATPase [Leptolyngbya sp. FACHB-402]|nr:AAA family ATPase [Leptolyngbya sp. FACHB-161]MBD2373899.1 AAA family ATPase [Leptolyngbya sp. FACHB-238]MBD2398301.1 AAA family ATPase [Leptolyngbya sp. FACHB-239]MBD2404202.1 AAA family ATPase [Leptolyngbya sp. FACHB-402]